MSNIIDKAKERFFQMVDEFGSDPYNLRSHILEVEKWARYLLAKFPQADQEVVMLGVWLHDIGHYPISTEIDHAIKGEERSKEFLEKEKYPSDKMVEVLDCIRLHRCCDVVPSSWEAKIIAFADSASHLTDAVYFRMLRDNKNQGKNFDVVGKMERDFRELGFFPEIQNELKELHMAWKKLIEVYEKVDLS